MHMDKQRSAYVGNLMEWLKQHRGVFLVVWVPTLVTAIYYLFIAADLYQSEAKFVLRSPNRMQVTSLTNILQTTGLANSHDDLFSVHDFIVSRDAIAALSQNLNLRDVFNRPEADFWASYPNPLQGNSEEDFYHYYTTRVTVIYDSTTGISTLRVKAFRPDDAQQLTTLLLKESEALVNRLNERARDNAVSDAERDVDLAENRVAEAQANLLEYRNRESMLDPKKASSAIADSASKMRAELIMTRARLSELQQTSPSSPLISGLKTRIGAIEGQLRNESARLTGSGASMAPKIGEYEQLILRQEFAGKALASAMASLETARAEARRQQIYLDHVVEPSKPDEAEYPRRFFSILVVFVSCFLAYSIARLLLAGIREHSQV